ncbi:hypothetical protein FP2506_07331 [Fulvimarina pelagi HTCC2506]|uniref:DUF1344 domain-containing protein n=1 Tax=Fulvimarina pelagi HTCC2506 TaxID=314231 RepID=Q0G6T0_9HYPH|nr:hypothetical protein [Fulvimarina pelagi]EAU42634.1 hypothetical protein FP2506_07331 [Fulvimarina pelagi HTCC2506]
MRLTLPVAAFAGLLFATAAFADSTAGTVAAFDRVDSIIVLTDKSIWDVSSLKDQLPEGLKAGDKINIVYQSAGDSGVGKLVSIKR